MIRSRILTGDSPPDAPDAGQPRPESRIRPHRLVRRVRASAATGVATALLIGLGAGSAYGYFTTSGAGHGSASTATMVPVTGSVGSPTTRLVPGGRADVAVVVTNPNPFAVTVVSASGGDVTVDDGHPACTPSSVTFTSPGVLSVTIPAGTTQALAFPNAAAMDASAPNNCQGASFSIPLTLTARSS